MSTKNQDTATLDAKINSQLLRLDSNIPEERTEAIEALHSLEGAYITPLLIQIANGTQRRFHPANKRSLPRMIFSQYALQIEDQFRAMYALAERANQADPDEQAYQYLRGLQQYKLIHYLNAPIDDKGNPVPDCTRRGYYPGDYTNPNIKGELKKIVSQCHPKIYDPHLGIQGISCLSFPDHIMTYKLKEILVSAHALEIGKVH